MIPDETKQQTPDPETEQAGQTETACQEDQKVNESAQSAQQTGSSSEEPRDDKKSDKKLKKECAELKDKLAKAESKNAELGEKYLRLMAEYDNFRKRSAKEKDGIYADAYTDALKAILPVIDNLERAVQFSEGDKVVEGVKMTLSQFTSALEKMGVEEIPAETFDPRVHNAVMHIEDDNYREGQIVEVFQKGYRKGDKIVRFAMVKVAN
ncbi:MAG: nucleotide exchange factor GrpE [Eubacteriales bacterium]